MIQSNDLRIGNWVYFTGNGNNNPVKVMELWQTQLVSDYMGNHLCLFYSDDDLQPIPLTPEILLSCGFEKVRDLTYVIVHSDNLHIVFIQSGIGFNITVTGAFGMVGLSDCYSVHQLQNLYFALTNTELEIKL